MCVWWVLRWPSLPHLHPKDSYCFCPKLSVLKILSIKIESFSCNVCCVYSCRRINGCSEDWVLICISPTKWAAFSLCVQYFQWIFYKLRPYVILSYNRDCVPFSVSSTWKSYALICLYFCPPTWVVSSLVCLIWMSYCIQTVGTRGQGRVHTKLSKELQIVYLPA